MLIYVGVWIYAELPWVLIGILFILWEDEYDLEELPDVLLFTFEVFRLDMII